MAQAQSIRKPSMDKGRQITDTSEVTKSKVSGVASKADRMAGSDSLTAKIDTIKKIDTLEAPGDSDIKDKITYKATDSIVYDIATKKMYLYNGAETHYQKITLNSDAIEFDWTTMTMTAQGVTDSSGETKGKPVFMDDGKEYRAGKMMYNFKNSKGKVFEVVTQEGDAYLHSEAVKRTDGSAWFGYNSKYTSCNLDHPHFYFKAKKIKLVPNKVMVTGPANLWVGDVPTPLYLPFGIFPIKQGRRSGLVLPKYGGDALNGFFLREGGYYWAASENFDLKATGTVYTNGTFGFNAASNVIFNYKFNSKINLGYIRSAPPDPDLPNVKATNDFSVALSFQLDPKASPTHSFNASVNIKTASFNQANRATDNSIFQTSFYSNINYAKTFSRFPFLSITLSANHSQNNQTRDLQITFPKFSFNVSRVTPFTSKIKSGDKKWYENFGIAYSFQAQNSLNTKDTLLSKIDLNKQLQYGANHNLRLDLPFAIKKVIQFSPSVTYAENWFFKSVNQNYVLQDQIVTLPGGYTIVNKGLGSYLNSDTLTGFKATREFTASFNVTMPFVGIYRFKNKLIKGLKHTVTPNVSINYHPDYGTAFFGYYGMVRKNISDAAPTPYSHFQLNNGYGNGPAAGKYAALNWGLSSNIDLKVYSKKDTVNHERKFQLFDQLSLSGGYNFAVDSLQLLPVNINIGVKILDNIRATFSGNFDPYAHRENGQINEFFIKNHAGLLRFNSGSFGLTANFKGKAKQTASPPLNKAQRMIKDYVSYNPDDYYDYDIPWNFNATFNMTLSNNYQAFTQRDSLTLSPNATFGGDFNLTPKWKIALSSGYDFNKKDFTFAHAKVIRSLHCWQLDFDWTAYPIANQQFQIELKIISPTLQDLKLTKKRTNYSGN